MFRRNTPFNWSNQAIKFKSSRVVNIRDDGELLIMYKSLLSRLKRVTLVNGPLSPRRGSTLKGKIRTSNTNSDSACFQKQPFELLLTPPLVSLWNSFHPLKWHCFGHYGVPQIVPWKQDPPMFSVKNGKLLLSLQPPFKAWYILQRLFHRLLVFLVQNAYDMLVLCFIEMVTFFKSIFRWRLRGIFK